MYICPVGESQVDLKYQGENTKRAASQKIQSQMLLPPPLVLYHRTRREPRSRETLPSGRPIVGPDKEVRRSAQVGKP
jgi:hypothetical protein